MADGYMVLGTQPYSYIDDLNRVVNGYRVTFKIIEFDEIATVDAPSLAPEIVKPKILEIVKNRKALAG